MFFHPPLIWIFTPGDTVNLIFYPGWHRKFDFLPRVSTVNLNSTPGVDRYFRFYPVCRPLIAFLPRVSTVNYISTPGWKQIMCCHQFVFGNLITFLFPLNSKLQRNSVEMTRTKQTARKSSGGEVSTYVVEHSTWTTEPCTDWRCEETTSFPFREINILYHGQTPILCVFTKWGDGLELFLEFLGGIVPDGTGWKTKYSLEFEVWVGVYFRSQNWTKMCLVNTDYVSYYYHYCVCLVKIV